MSHCLNCHGPCRCSDPVIPGVHATYDPDHGGWVSWEAWRERLSRKYRVKDRTGRERSVVRAEKKGKR